MYPNQCFKQKKKNIKFFHLIISIFTVLKYRCILHGRVGNIYRPPDSKIEYNDRFEEFIDFVSNQNKELILLGALIEI